MMLLHMGACRVRGSAVPCPPPLGSLFYKERQRDQQGVQGEQGVAVSLRSPHLNKTMRKSRRAVRDQESPSGIHETEPQGMRHHTCSMPCCCTLTAPQTPKDIPQT